MTWNLFRNRDPRPGARTQRGVNWATGGIFGAMFVASWIWGSSQAAPAGGGSRASYGLVLFVTFAASVGVGAVLGFLFGLPRARLAEPLTGAEASAGATPRRNYLANSNLIKVSDWLTTIVIGLTLVNLGRVIPAARSLSESLKDPLGGTAAAEALGMSTIVFGALCGFMLMYLYVSIRIRELLEDAENNPVATPAFVAVDVATAKHLAAELSILLDLPDDAADDAVISGQSPEPGSILRGERRVEVATQPAS